MRAIVSSSANRLRRLVACVGMDSAIR
jgi:hypothetical protein